MPHPSATQIDLQDKILQAALPDVPFDGWTVALLERAADKAGIDGHDLHAAFPDGVTGLIAHFSRWADAQTLLRLEKANLADMRVRDRITLGVRTRLEVLAPHKQSLSTALAHMSLPPRNLKLAKLVWETADKIWWAAGDSATDYNHYTKRFLLSGVLSATALFWLNDKSSGHADTWEFLDRRIENVMKVGQKIATFKKKRAS